MEALMFFGMAFGFLFLVAAFVGISTVISEKRKTNKMHNEFLKQFD